jgi:hypothetical protein
MSYSKILKIDAGIVMSSETNIMVEKIANSTFSMYSLAASSSSSDIGSMYFFIRRFNFPAIKFSEIYVMFVANETVTIALL